MKILNIITIIMVLALTLANVSAMTLAPGDEVDTSRCEWICETPVSTNSDGVYVIPLCQWECDNSPPYRPAIDVVFLIDSTGSMQDEIRSVKTHIKNIVKDVQGGQPSPMLRVGIVTYRDHKPEEREYLVRKQLLTYNVDVALEFLKRLEARGGGDHPEAVADGLDAAVNEMNWNEDAKKMIFLIGDAAPHGEGSRDHSFEQGCPDQHDYRESIEDANQRDIKIYTISGSGMDHVGVKVWKDIAKKTGGEYKELTYTRRDLDDYFDDEGLPSIMIASAKSDSDYDKETNTIMTNDFGAFASEAITTEAMDVGVVYQDDEEKTDKDVDVIYPVDEKTDEDTTEADLKIVSDPADNGLLSFFKKVFSTIFSWN